MFLVSTAIHASNRFQAPSLSYLSRLRGLAGVALLGLCLAAGSLEARVATPPAASEDMPLYVVGGVYALSVSLNNQVTMLMVLDSGASEVQLPADVVWELIHTGSIQDRDVLPVQSLVLADGSTVSRARFVLRYLTIGQMTLANVRVMVGPVGSPPLLGQSALARFPTWHIDNRRGRLVVTTPPTSTTSDAEAKTVTAVQQKGAQLREQQAQQEAAEQRVTSLRAAQAEKQAA